MAHHLDRLAQRHEIDERDLRKWLIEAMVLGGVADGELDQRESEGIIHQIATLPIMKGIGADELRADLERAVSGLIADGYRARVHALAGALPRYAHRVLAFRGAVAVAFANGRLDSGEFDMLRLLQSVLGITESDVEHAFETVPQAGEELLHAEHEPIDAYLDCLLMAAASNGRLAPEELATILAFVISRDEFDGIEADHIHDMIQHRLDEFAHGATEERLSRLARELVDPTQRENAYGLAASVVVADGTLDSAEQGFLSRLRVALDLDESRAELAMEHAESEDA